MPPDRSRTHNSQGRQKSCAECAKAKRRCDLRQPSCLRCSKQGLECSYPPPRSNMTSQGFAQEIGPDEDILSLDAANSIGIDVLDFDFPTATASVDALDDMLIGDIPDQMPLERIDLNLNYNPGRQFTASQLSPLARSRVGYCMEQLKLAPAMMVLENKTHWCHSHLYEDGMPRLLQDTQAACALYMNKNATNATVVARHITERAKEVIESPIPDSPLAVLAHTQSLLLYQIILLFEGDFQYRGHAEASVQALEIAGSSLHAIVKAERDPCGSLLIYPSAAARAAWKAYIFRESARRTHLILFHLMAVCSLLRGWLSSCDHDLVVGNRILFSSHLWNASSAFDFAVAWNEKKHLLVKELDLTSLLGSARPEDLDTFGKMMLASVLGIDDVKGWFHARGGEF